MNCSIYRNIFLDKTDEEIWVLTLESKILNIETRKEINDFLVNFDKYARLNKKPKCLIITGKDKFFCIGADLKEVQLLAKNLNSSDMSRFIHSGRSIIKDIMSLPVITIAAINGYALGGGLELAMACDFRVTTATYEKILGLPESTLGFSPGWLGTVLLPRIVGLSKAKDLILSGRKIDPAYAKEIGLIDEIFEVGIPESEPIKLPDLLKEAKLFTTRFNNVEAEVIRILKRNFLTKRYLGIYDSSFAEESKREEEDFIECFKNGCAKKGIEKFFALRKKK